MWNDLLLEFDNDVPVLLKIVIRKSKTDQEGTRDVIVISNNDSSYNPILWIRAYANVTGCIPGQTESKIFKISQDSVRKRLQNMLKSYNISNSRYCTHSFRKGGAHAAAIAGVPDYKIKAHGRWRSSTYTTYTSIQMEEAGKSITQLI